MQPLQLRAVFAALLVGRQPDDVPVLHNAHTILQVAHTEFRTMQQLVFFKKKNDNSHTQRLGFPSAVHVAAAAVFGRPPQPAPTGSSC